MLEKTRITLYFGKPHRLTTDKKCWRAEKRNGRGTEKSEESYGGKQTKNEKEPAAGDEKIELHLY